MMSLNAASSVAMSPLRRGRDRKPLRRYYTVFGGVLSSELEFPELAIAEQGVRATWTLQVEHSAPLDTDLTALGDRQLGIESYRLWRTPLGLRLEYSHAGHFDISTDGSRITWYYHAGALPELVRSIVLGPALALALELAGFLCLHGSAVVVGNQGVVFLGPKHHGKSTIASALTLAGARLMGDDLVAVAPGPPAIIRPGVASVRLWGDTVKALPMNGICESLIPGVKTTATGFADHALMHEQAPLAGIYVLAPADKAREATCQRTRLGPTEAAIALAHQTKLADSLIGMRAAGAQLAAAAAVAATVPVYALSVARDLARLPELVEQVFAWHQGTTLLPRGEGDAGHPTEQPMHHPSSTPASDEDEVRS
jgi:hypothetical protein